MARQLRHLILGLGATISVSGVVSAGPTTFEQFESCAAVQAAVRKAGPNGLATDNPFYIVVYDDPQCYRGDGVDFTSFAETREIAGEQCHVGYVCEDDIPSQR